MRSEEASLFESLEHSVIMIIDVSAANGVSALVLNRPTPLTVGELSGETRRFEAFGDNLLHGGGEFGQSDGTPGDMVPMYWLHACDWLPEARQLSEAAFIGGDSEMLAAAVGGGSLAPAAVRFFWRHLPFRPGEFEVQLGRGCWRKLTPSAWEAVC
jgi:hypothetical protein